jgi:MFS family permease
MSTTIDKIADTRDPGIAPNAKRLLWAGFMAILAAGVGFAIRGGIFDIWRDTFNFTAAQVGLVNGAGFTGFCFGIIIGGLVADRIGYGKLVVAAFSLHVLSALVTFCVGNSMAPQTAFALLWTGTFLFAVANGTLEAVANPLVATLFPQNRTHYLNILHASWPAGMIIGAGLGLLLGEKLHLPWQIQLAAFLLPTAFYGLMFLGQHFPKSEASAKGLSLGEMFKDVGIMGSIVAAFFLALFVQKGLGPLLAGFTGSDFFTGNIWMYISIAVGVILWGVFSNISGWAVGAALLFVLFVTHALVGAVELGTDGWIQNITGNIFTPSQGKLLFIYTSAFMFALRFCAHFIEKNLRLSPVGLLMVCASLACVGLLLVSNVTTIIGAVLALTVYALGKTFFWPTMLAVASDRFPRTGAVAISFMGGIGMMSAGLLGSAGLGYAKDRFAGDSLQKANEAVYQEYKAETPSPFLFFSEVHGIDGKKLGEAKAAGDKRTENQKLVVEANEQGDRRTLRADAFIPATMACIYLLILLYFVTIGGYKPVTIDPERLAGGVEGPMEA